MGRHEPSRVVVAVTPRLFGDALSVALRGHDLEVEVCPFDGIQVEAEPSLAGHFDLAVTTGALPPGIDADIVIVLSDARGRSASVIRAPGVEERRRLRGLDSVLGLVDDLLGDR